MMAAEILRSRKIHTDDTSVPVIVPGETKTKNGYFWAYCGDDQHRYSVYDFTLSHCRDGPARWLRGYCGYLSRPMPMEATTASPSSRTVA
jgi:hypothetical protein